MKDYFFVRANDTGRFNTNCIVWAGKLPCAELEYGEYIYRIWVDVEVQNSFVSTSRAKNIEPNEYTAGLQFVPEKFGTNIWMSISTRFITKVEKMDNQTAADINQICKRISTCKLSSLLALLAKATYE